MAELRSADIDPAPWPSLAEAREHMRVLSRCGWRVVEERTPHPRRGDGARIAARVHHPDTGTSTGEITYLPGHDPGD